MGVIGAVVLVVILAIAATVQLVIGKGAHRGVDQQLTAMQRWAAHWGWRYVGGEDQRVSGRWRGEPFGAGRPVYNLLERTGPEGAWLACTLHVGTTGTDSVLAGVTAYELNGPMPRKVDHYQSVVVRVLPASLPWLQLEPNGMLTRLPRVPGVARVRFGDDAFDRAWYVSTSDERFARAVIHPRAMQWLMSAGVRGVPLRIEGDGAMTWHDDGLDVNRIGPMMWLVDGLIGQIPRDEWRFRTAPPVTPPIGWPPPIMDAR